MDGDQEFWSNVLESTMRLFVEPEVKTRLGEGRIDTDWRLWGAQIIMNVAEPPRFG